MAKTTVKAAAKKTEKVNPFAIKKDMTFTGNRSSVHAEFLPLLEEQVQKLVPGDKTTSVHIPVTICATRSQAANLVLNLKRKMNGGKKKGEIYLTSKAILDAKKTYIGSRVWRLS